MRRRFFSLFLGAAAVFSTMAVVLLHADDKNSTGRQEKAPDGAVAALESSSKSKTGNPKKPQITVSKETTYLTEPLKADGSVDYAAAINERYSKGVTPENNAAAALYQILGSGPVEEKYRKQFFRLLGMPIPAEYGNFFADFLGFFKSFPEFKKNSTQIWEERDKSESRPWKREEYPFIASWVDHNESFIKEIERALAKERFYIPLVVEEEGHSMMEGSTLHISELREIAQFLKIHALLMIGEGRIDSAKKDIFLLHRLGRHLCAGFLSVDVLIGLACDNYAMDVQIHLALSDSMKSQEILEYGKTWHRSPLTPSLADQMDFSDRLFNLDYLVSLALHGPGKYFHLFFLNYEKPKWLDEVEWQSLDYDTICHMHNNYQDRYVKATRLPSRRERTKEFENLNKEIMEKADALRQWNTWKSLAANVKNPSEAVAWVLLVQMTSSPAMINASDLHQMRQELTQLAFALAAYRAEKGSYPDKLDPLAPDYIEKIPVDIFADDASLKYRKTDDGFLLYSVGVNGKDDGGQERDLDNAENTGDDLVVRFPLKTPGKK